MLLQEAMIERLRHICRQDRRIVAAMLYGSFTRAEADAFSDIDVALFFADETLGEIDQRAWVSQIAPVELYYVNEFGNGVAIFDNLVRGEFHFDAASDMHKVETWKGNAWFPSLAATLLVDPTGQLARHLQALTGPPPLYDTPERARFLSDSLVNWVLFGANVLARGEVARALEILRIVHDYLLWMVRLVEHSTAHWATPTKSLEQDISPAAYARFVACTANMDEVALWRAYLVAWGWGKELMLALAQRHGFAMPETLVLKLDSQLARYQATRA